MTPQPNGFHYFSKEGRQFDFLQVAIEVLEENEGGDLNEDMDFMNVVASSMDVGVFNTKCRRSVMRK